MASQGPLLLGVLSVAENDCRRHQEKTEIGPERVSTHEACRRDIERYRSVRFSWYYNAKRPEMRAFENGAGYVSLCQDLRFPAVQASNALARKGAWNAEHYSP